MAVAGKRARPKRPFTVCSQTKLENGESSEDAVLGQALASKNLDGIISRLRDNPSSIPSLTQSQIRSIFDSVERATAESDENTVNKRALVSDDARAQMTALYKLLREGGRLRAFGAVGRGPPASAVAATFGGPIYPAAGSKIITPDLLGRITRANGLEIDMVNLTPRQTNVLLYGGAFLALLEGVVSLATDVDFNFLVACTLLLAVMDQLLVSGAFSDTVQRLLQPGTTARIARHEAGHFLAAYLLGCPVEGVVLSTWEALRDGRFGGRASAVSAGTSYFDLDLSEQIEGRRPLTRESIDRYSVIVMAGIAAEAMEYGRADGGAGDEDALVRFLRSLNPRSGNAVAAWTPELIRNQARWGATQAVLLLKEYRPCYDALVGALDRGGNLGQCIAAIEEAATKEGLGWLRKPLGRVLEEGEYGRWVPTDDNGDFAPSDDSAGKNAHTNGSDGNTQRSNDSVFKLRDTTDGMPTSGDATNGVPTYGNEPITSTEEFLKMYRDVREKKLAIIDEQSEEINKQ